MRDANVLILDEPTAVLTPQEAVELGEVLRRMVAEGRSVIFISHKLDEVVSSVTRPRCCSVAQPSPSLSSPRSARRARATHGRRRRR